jgi:hypothetical protein
MSMSVCPGTHAASSRGSLRSPRQIITYSDLESDYLNPVDATERLNRFLIPEYAAHTLVTVLCLLTLNLIPLVANGILLGWHVKRYMERKHLVDATQIYPTLSERKKQSLAKLGFYTVRRARPRARLPRRRDLTSAHASSARPRPCARRSCSSITCTG